MRNATDMICGLKARGHQPPPIDETYASHRLLILRYPITESRRLRHG